MKIVFAGAGAVGCHYGSRLQQAGNRVVYLARGAHLAALEQRGLLHESEGKSTRLEVEASGDPAVVAAADVVLFSCKMIGLRRLIESVKSHLDAHALLVTLQNGIEAPGWVAAAFPEHAVAAGTAFIGVRLEGPGRVVHTAAGGMRLGLWQSGRGEQHLATLVGQLNDGGVPAHIDADPVSMLWRKLLWNTGFNAITAITRRYAREMCDSEETLALVRSAMQETVAVARAEGVDLSEADINSHIDVTRNMGPVKTSMWQDIEAGHPSEVDYLNGVVVRRGEALGVATPANRMLMGLVHTIEGQSRE